MKEVNVAKKVISLLKEWHWEVYQEVSVPGGRIDIVAKMDKILWAIECKTSFSLALIEQGIKNRRFCHYSSIASPRGGSQFARQICRDYGIGVFVVVHEASEQVRPKLRRKVSPPKLYNEQKTWAEAGTNGGGYFTKFGRTKANLIQIVKGSPGIQFNQALKKIDHHYRTLSTAKSCLRKLIDSDVIQEIETKIIDKKLCLFLK